MVVASYALNVTGGSLAGMNGMQTIISHTKTEGRQLLAMVKWLALRVIYPKVEMDR